MLAIQKIFSNNHSPGRKSTSSLLIAVAIDVFIDAVYLLKKRGLKFTAKVVGDGEKRV